MVNPAIVARGCKRLKIQGARSAGRRRHTPGMLRDVSEYTLAIQPLEAAAADGGEKSGLTH